MNRVVICMILAAFIYTVVAIIVFVRVGAEPSTLTENVLSVLVAVIWIGVPFILAFIFIMSVIDDSGDKKQKEEKK